jgi:transposase
MVGIREVLNTLLYLARTSCQWELLPHDLLPKSTVWDYFHHWRADGTWQRIVDALRQAEATYGRLLAGSADGGDGPRGRCRRRGNGAACARVLTPVAVPVTGDGLGRRQIQELGP